MITCTRRIQFCAGHRVMGHENKCANPHGHNYVVHITAALRPARPSLDAIGRVIDFSVLKAYFGEWIEQHWDHGFIVNEHDHEMIEALRMIQTTKVYPLPYNPTAENLARYLVTHVAKYLDGDWSKDISVVRVVIEETENCSATFEHS